MCVLVSGKSERGLQKSVHCMHIASSSPPPPLPIPSPSPLSVTDAVISEGF